NSQRPDAKIAKKSDDFTDGFDPLRMPGHAGETAKFRPPSVSIHDDGDMAWQKVRIKEAEQVGLGEVFSVAWSRAFIHVGSIRPLWCHILLLWMVNGSGQELGLECGQSVIRNP